jgi:dTDP-3-amino-3,6-dideoxy-alpha-D-glucopyranose N,N-dimethyltransferase
MFRKTQAYYDALYSFKDYSAESKKVRAVISKRSRTGGRTLLDVACGTGAHLAHLRRHFKVEGLDLDGAMLAVARKRLKGVRLHRADMRTFRLASRFDAVVCLFGSIGYARTVAGLDRTVANLARHTRPGGVVLVEPWIFPAAFTDGHLNVVTFASKDLAVARVARTTRRGRLSRLHLEYLVATARRTDHLDETHALGLFTVGEYKRAFVRAGLKVAFDKWGLAGRGLFIGTKPLAKGPHGRAAAPSAQNP